METTEKKRFAYEFGKFALDPREKTLFADGVPVHLPAKEFETLLLLIENNGRALSKQEMMTAIWQDAFVEEGNLAKQISRLRKLLNTNGENLIETVPKHGYRFSTELRLVANEPEVPVILEKRTVKRLTVAYQEDNEDKLLLAGVKEKHQSGESRQSSLRFFLIAGVLLLAVVGVISYFSYFRSPNASNQPENVSAVKSVAVLPFKPVGVEEDGDEYLRLGLTDALVTKLSSLKQIVVRLTNAVRKYSTQDPLVAGRELGVEVVLDGNVQRIGQQIRVTVQLVSVRDGRLLWGGKFDEKFTDIFSVQDAISEQAARYLEPELSGKEKSLLAKRYTTNTDAHDAYVRGRFFWNRRTADDLKEAIKHFNEAVEKDPNYALAYAGLADDYSLLADYDGALPAEAYPKAKEAAMKALELDDELAEAHTSLSYVKMYYYHDWQGAQDGYRRAIALNPNYATARHWYSEYLTAMGRFDEAFVEIRRAKEIDPLSPGINAQEVWILFYARRFDEAIERGRRIAEMNPDFAEIYDPLKRCYDQKGMYAEAIAARQKRRKLAGWDATETAALKSAASTSDAAVYWKKRLEQEIEEARNELPMPFEMAEIYARLGEKDLAFEWLDKAIENRNYPVLYLRVVPNLDPLRTDPRFDNLLGRIGLAS